MSLPYPRDPSWPSSRPGVSERELIHGYSGIVRSEGRNVERRETCACGGVIEVEIQTEILIQAAVRRHQATVQHQGWWAVAGWQ